MEVKFNEPEYASHPLSPAKKPSVITSLVIKAGLAKDARGARNVLVLVLGVVVLTTILMFAFAYPQEEPIEPLPEPALQ